MKKSFNILIMIALASMLAFAYCKKDTDFSDATVELKYEKVTTEGTTMKYYAEYSYSASLKAATMLVSQNYSLSDAQTVTCDLGNKTIYASVTGIINNANYYYKLKYDTGYGVLESDVKKFKIREYADLGLSVLWATCNVGANSPEDYGDYFAWGETTTKSIYHWSTYKWCNGSDFFTKYNTYSIYGTVDNKTVLEMSDDAANANWGGNWRMPTTAEWQELHDNTTSTWTIQNGVYGRRFTSTMSGYTDKSLFLPATGYRRDSGWICDFSSGYYWLSSLTSSEPYGVYNMCFGSGFVNPQSYHYNRYDGLTVRPVCPSQN